MESGLRTALGFQQEKGLGRRRVWEGRRNGIFQLEQPELVGGVPAQDGL